MAKIKQRPPDEGSPEWMTTFSDLMNLLLCFFVLLFASSTLDEGKIQKIVESFDNVSFSVMDQYSISLIAGDMMSGGVTQLSDTNSMLEAGKVIQGDIGDDHNIASPNDADAISDSELKNEYEKRGEEQSEQMYEEIMQAVESYSIEDKIAMNYTTQYVELDLKGSILFDSGVAEVKEDSKMFLQKIASILSKYKNNIIEIEGHTDDVPISTVKFEDNRELSTERARNVYEYIMSQADLIDENMKIAGYGESRPIASNETPEGRARNRRVVIKIYNQQYSVY